MSLLCDECKDESRQKGSLRKCTTATCDNQIGNGFRYCPKCSKERNICQGCGLKLDQQINTSHIRQPPVGAGSNSNKPQQEDKFSLAIRLNMRP